MEYSSYSITIPFYLLDSNLMIATLGRTLLSFPEWLGRLFFLLFDMVMELIRLVCGQYKWSLFQVLRKQTLLQVWYTAIQVIPLLTLIAMGLGGVLIGVGFGLLQQFGAEDLFVPLIQYGLIGEVLPLGLTLIILARSSTAITADVASQVINGDLDVMKAHGMSIPLLITTPRILGILLSFISVFGIFIGVLIGSTLLWAPLFDITFYQLQSIWTQSLTLQEYEWVAIKLITNALLIGSISCYKALHIQRDIRELPKASSQSVILALFAIFLFEGVWLFVRWFT